MSRTILQLISPLVTSQKVSNQIGIGFTGISKKASRTPKFHEKTPVRAQRDLRAALRGPHVLLLLLLLVAVVFDALLLLLLRLPWGHRPLKSQPLPAFDLPKCLCCCFSCLCCCCCCFRCFFCCFCYPFGAFFLCCCCLVLFVLLYNLLLLVRLLMFVLFLVFLFFLFLLQIFLVVCAAAFCCLLLAVCCFCCCFLGRRPLKNPPLPLLTFQNVNNNFLHLLRKSQKHFLCPEKRILYFCTPKKAHTTRSSNTRTSTKTLRHLFPLILPIQQSCQNSLHLFECHFPTMEKGQCVLHGIVNNSHVSRSLRKSGTLTNQTQQSGSGRLSHWRTRLELV